MTTNRTPAVTPVPISELVMIDPRTPLAPEHLEQFAAEVAVIEAECPACGEPAPHGPSECPLGIHPVPTATATPEQIAETVLAHYLTIAVENRWDDLDDYLADVNADPAGIVTEVLDCAADLGYLAGAAPEDDATYAAIAAQAEAFTRAARRWVYAEVARQAGQRALAAL